MEQINCTTTRKKHKHILRDDRYVIEQMLKAKQEQVEIVQGDGLQFKDITARYRARNMATIKRGNI